MSCPVVRAPRDSRPAARALGNPRSVARALGGVALTPLLTAMMLLLPSATACGEPVRQPPMVGSRTQGSATPAPARAPAESGRRAPAARGSAARGAGARGQGARGAGVRALPRLLDGIAACPGWSPLNGLNYSKCAPFTELITQARTKTLQGALFAQLGHRTPAVRYAVSYTLNQYHHAPITRRGQGEGVLRALRGETAHSIITWLGILAGKIHWAKTGLGPAVRALAAGPSVATRRAMMCCLMGSDPAPPKDRFAFVVARALGDDDGHTRLLAASSLTNITGRAPEVCALWATLAKDEKHPRLASHAAATMMRWKGRCRSQFPALLAEIGRRLRADRGVEYDHYFALGKLCDPKASPPAVHKPCVALARGQLGRSRHATAMLKIVAAHAPDGLAVAKRHLRDRRPGLRQTARELVYPLETRAETFVNALTVGSWGRAHALMARDTAQLWDRERDRIKAVAVRLAKIRGLRLALRSQAPVEESRCWRRPRPPGHCTGPCKPYRLRATRFRYVSTAPWRPRPLVISVKVADYHRQPPHPDPLEERIRKDQRRYQVVGWEVQE